MRGTEKTPERQQRGLTNEQQLWLMNQVKMGQMTIDDAVEFTRKHEEEEGLSMDEEDNLHPSRDGGRRSSTTKFLIKLFSKKNKVKKELKEKTVSVSEEGTTGEFPANDNLISLMNDLKEKKIFNFSVYKTAKHKGSQRRILQIDFEARIINLINRGNISRKCSFSSLVQAGGRDGKQVSMYFDDNEEIEIDVENLADKTKILRFLNLVIEQNECDERGDEFDPITRLQNSFSVIKSGILEKSVPNAKFGWNRRLVILRSGELAYYRESEDEQLAALNIIRLSEDGVSVNLDDSNSFTVATTKDSFQFRIPENSAALPCVMEQLRDEWIAAVKKACKRVDENDDANSEATGSTSGSFPGVGESSNIYLLEKLTQLRLELEKLQNADSITIQENVLTMRTIVNSMQNDINAKFSRSNTLTETFKTKSMDALTSSSSPIVNGDKPKTAGEVIIGGLPDGNKLDVSKEEANENHVANGNLPSVEIPIINELPPPPEEQISDFPCEAVISDDEFHKDAPSPTKSPEKPSSPVLTPPSSPTTRLPTPPPPAEFASEVSSSLQPNENDSKVDSVSPESNSAEKHAQLPPPPPPITTNGGSPSIPPPPPPPAVSSTPGIPPPPPSGIPLPPSVSSTSRNNSPKITGDSMRPIHWAVVPKTLLSKSFWNTAKDLKDDIDRDKLLSMFKAIGNKKDDDSGTLKHGDKTPRKKVETLLDLKTAQNLGIFMAGFKVRGDDLLQKLTILKEENGGLSTGHLSGLRKFCPEPDLKDMLIKSKDNDLAKVDQFMLELCLIPKISIRLDVLYTIRELPLQMETIKPEIDSALSACQLLGDSKCFEEVLTYVLAVTNAINCTNSKGTVKGIRISTLQKTITMRTNDRKRTLLHVIASELKRLKPDLLKLPEELSEIQKTQLFSTKALFAEIDILRKDVLKCKKNCDVLKRKKNKPTQQDLDFCKEVEMTLTKYDSEIGVMNERCQDTKKTFAKMLAKFGEPPESESQELFKVIQEFLINFKKESLMV